jgi:hypothetical protein
MGMNMISYLRPDMSIDMCIGLLRRERIYVIKIHGYCSVAIFRDTSYKTLLFGYFIIFIDSVKFVAT